MGKNHPNVATTRNHMAEVYATSKGDSTKTELQARDFHLEAPHKSKMHETYSALIDSKTGFNESEFKTKFNDYNQAVIRFFHDELQQPQVL